MGKVASALKLDILRLPIIRTCRQNGSLWVLRGRCNELCLWWWFAALVLAKTLTRLGHFLFRSSPTAMHSFLPFKFLFGGSFRISMRRQTEIESQTSFSEGFPHFYGRRIEERGGNMLVLEGWLGSRHSHPPLRFN